MRAIAIELKRGWSAICLDRVFWFGYAVLLLLYLLAVSWPLWLMLFLVFFVVYGVVVICLRGPLKWFLVALPLVPIIIRFGG